VGELGIAAAIEEDFEVSESWRPVSNPRVEIETQVLDD
jgi:hypothetical protein